MLGEQTREHSDLGVAVDRDHDDKLVQALAERGFSRDEPDDDSDWNSVQAAQEAEIERRASSKIRDPPTSSPMAECSTACAITDPPMV